MTSVLINFTFSVSSLLRNTGKQCVGLLPLGLSLFFFSILSKFLSFIKMNLLHLFNCLFLFVQGVARMEDRCQLVGVVLSFHSADHAWQQAPLPTEQSAWP